MANKECMLINPLLNILVYLSRTLEGQFLLNENISGIFDHDTNACSNPDFKCLLGRKKYV